MYRQGVGVSKDHAKSLSLYKKAALQNHAGAQFGLALMYVNGIGTPKDIIEAERWYRLAIKQGHIMAMNNLAYMFSENDMNLDEAEKLSRATLETNPERAMFLDTLGWVLHKNGKYQEAIELLKRAVSLKQRNSEYRRHLNAVLLAAGDGGETVSCDTIEARDAYKLGLEIQQTVRESDLQALFSLVEEELTHGPRKSAVQGRSFSEVFSSKWKEMVLSAKPDCQPVGWRGYMLGHGMIWYRAEGIFSINDAQILFPQRLVHRGRKYIVRTCSRGMRSSPVRNVWRRTPFGPICSSFGAHAIVST